MEGAQRADRACEGVRLSDAAALWSGAAYEKVAAHFAEIHDRVVETLEIEPGDQVLDVGTGTGEVAIRAARAGAAVVGVDLSAEQLAKARAAADAEELAIDWVECDCQRMPLPDCEFDAVASVFGFVFAPDHARSASELARVCKPGGRLVLTSWTYDEFSRVGERLGREYPPGEDAREWSNENHARERLTAFDLRFERGEWVAAEASAAAMWELIAGSVPPMKVWLDRLDDRGREEAKRAYSAVFPDGVLRRSYVLILGRRR